MQRDTSLLYKTLFFLCSIAVMAATLISQARATEEPDLNEISSGTLMLRDAQGVYSDGPLINSAVRMKISGMVASVTVEQTFSNPATNWLEGLYLFPLPASAAVNALTIELDGRVIRGSVAEKKQAEERYQQATQNGQLASLVSQQRPNLFTTKIANIAPGSAIQVSIHYIQTLEFNNDEFSLRLPMTMTPRYTNATVQDPESITGRQFAAANGYSAGWQMPHAQLQASLYSPGAVATVHSPTHELLLQAHSDQAGVDISFATAQPMNRDFVLSWSPALHNQPMVTSWIETVARQDYLLSMLLPPKTAVTDAELKRELILVIDTSGSMAGESIRAAKQALYAALDGLKSHDRFNLIEFNNTARTLFNGAVNASPNKLYRARSRIAALHADGGTEMQSALQQAFANPTQGYLRQVVFVTDGSIGNEDHLLRFIRKNLRQSRLFTVGIGSAPNGYFMRKAAQEGRGSYTYIDNIQQAQETISQLFLRLENPALTDIQVSWLGDQADFAPDPVADLYLGQPLILSAKLAPATQGFTVSGRFGSTPWQQTIQLESAVHVNSGLSTVWARQKIASLMDAQRHASNADKYQARITQIALEHQLVSRYTSLVAIDSQPLRPAGMPLQSSQVATALPAGYSGDLLALPQGAAGSDSLLLLALISSVLAGIAFVLQQRLTA